MSRILLAGDTHGNASHLASVFMSAHDRECDLIIQLGDFGYGWKMEAASLRPDGISADWFSLQAAKLVETSGIPIHWLGGNHENYADLFSRIDIDATGLFEMYPGVSYLARGTEFWEGGVKFLACGGAASVDKAYRNEGTQWWPQEAITEEDIEKCAEAGKVDVLLTHDFPWECNIVDRHLDARWGPEATKMTRESRQRVSRILAAAEPDIQVHGHLHIRYNEVVELANGHRTTVIGLDCDGTSMRDSTIVFDTEEFRQKKMPDLDIWNQTREEEE